MHEGMHSRTLKVLTKRARKFFAFVQWMLLGWGQSNWLRKEVAKESLILGSRGGET